MAISLRRSRDPPEPSIRQQLSFVVKLFQTLTNLYFLLIEQKASTTNNSTRSSIAVHLKQLEDAIRGVTTDEKKQGGSSSSAAIVGTRKQTRARRIDAGLLNVRHVHAERIRALAVVQTILQNKEHGGQGGAQKMLQPSIAQVTSALTELDHVLVQLMQRARIHAANQARIRALVERIEERDADTTSTIKQLSELRDRCRSLVKIGTKEKLAIERAQEQPLAYEEILRYARTLSQTTTAPPGFTFESAAGREGNANGGGVASNRNAIDNGRTDGPDVADDAAATTTATSHLHGLDQIPAHLQDKLPFPSVDAIRRGASEVRPPSWSMFQRGQLVTTEGDLGEEGRTMQDVDMTDEQSRQSKRAATTQQRRTVAAAPVTMMASGGDDEDGFGLDLS